jgi:hypothetical protein
MRLGRAPTTWTTLVPAMGRSLGRSPSVAEALLASSVVTKLKEAARCEWQAGPCGTKVTLAEEGTPAELSLSYGFRDVELR